MIGDLLPCLRSQQNTTRDGGPRNAERFGNRGMSREEQSTNQWADGSGRIGADVSGNDRKVLSYRGGIVK